LSFRIGESPMIHCWRAAVCATGLLCLCFLVSPAASQPAPAVPKNPNVAIEYVAPRSAQFHDIYQRLKKLQVLETMAVFLAPVRLPKTITIRTMECGALDVAYESGQPVTICYEFVREIENTAPVSSNIRIGTFTLSKTAIIIGAFIDLALQKVAHAVLDVTDVPVWGRMDDAADYMAALVMLRFSKEPAVIVATLAGTSWFLARRSFVGSRDFSDVVHGRDAQRFYNYACMAYGAYPKGFEFLVTNGNLPKARAERCGATYRKVRRSFLQTIMPHVDLELLKKVRALDWPKVLHISGG
jgi:Putative metallopeptidase